MFEFVMVLCFAYAGFSCLLPQEKMQDGKKVGRSPGGRREAATPAGPRQVPLGETEPARCLFRRRPRPRPHAPGVTAVAGCGAAALLRWPCRR